MKGIILAGGSGTRLYPTTKGISKQLIPIYDKPMIYYPLSTLMSAGIRDIAIITTEEDQPQFKRLLGDGSNYGINLTYFIQPSPDGLAQAFLITDNYIHGSACAMILGDNIFYGLDLEQKLVAAAQEAEKGYSATIFGIEVKDPERFGIMELDDNNNVLSVEEKPKNPKSNYAITGLYFYPSGVNLLARLVTPSERGELEITSLNDIYLKDHKLTAEVFEEGFIWFDTGTFESELDASNTIKTIENITAKLIGCPEAIAYQKGWITKEKLKEIIELHKKNSYGKYLQKLIDRS